MPWDWLIIVWDRVLSSAIPLGLLTPTSTVSPWPNTLLQGVSLQSRSLYLTRHCCVLSIVHVSSMQKIQNKQISPMALSLHHHLPSSYESIPGPYRLWFSPRSRVILHKTFMIILLYIKSHISHTKILCLSFAASTSPTTGGCTFDPTNLVGLISSSLPNHEKFGGILKKFKKKMTARNHLAVMSDGHTWVGMYFLSKFKKLRVLFLHKVVTFTNFGAMQTVLLSSLTDQTQIIKAIYWSGYCLKLPCHKGKALAPINSIAGWHSLQKEGPFSSQPLPLQKGCGVCPPQNPFGVHTP